jgi:hypothetical protein
MYVIYNITNADKLIHNYQVLYRFSDKLIWCKQAYSLSA